MTSERIQTSRSILWAMVTVTAIGVGACDGRDRANEKPVANDEAHQRPSHEAVARERVDSAFLATGLIYHTVLRGYSAEGAALYLYGFNAVGTRTRRIDAAELIFYGETGQSQHQLVGLREGTISYSQVDIRYHPGEWTIADSSRSAALIHDDTIYCWSGWGDNVSAVGCADLNDDGLYVRQLIDSVIVAATTASRINSWYCELNKGEWVDVISVLGRARSIRLNDDSCNLALADRVIHSVAVDSVGAAGFLGLFVRSADGHLAEELSTMMYYQLVKPSGPDFLRHLIRDLSTPDHVEARERIIDFIRFELEASRYPDHPRATIRAVLAGADPEKSAKWKRLLE